MDRRLAGLALVATLATASVSPTGAVAQEDRSIFSLIDPEGRVIELGSEVEGVLQPGDVLSSDGRRIQVWAVRLPAGEAVRVELSSSDFDAFLYVVGPSLGEGLRDDDGAGGLNALVCFETAAEGEYRVVAASLDGSPGAFRLGVHSGSDAACAGAGGIPGRDPVEALAALEEVSMVGALPIPGEVVGSFTGDEAWFDSRPIQGWRLAAEAGHRLAITLVASEFDPFLFFVGPGFDEVLTDDDGAGGRNARICVEIPEDGTFGLFAAPFGDMPPGAEYRVSVLEGFDAEAECEGIFHLAPASEIAALLRLEAGARAVGPDQEVEGELTGEAARHPLSGEPVQPWLLTAPGGSVVFVDVVSEGFDPKVWAVWPEAESVLSNDDYGDGCNSRLELRVPPSGEVLLLPGSFSEFGSGTFLLRVSTDPPPLEPGGCVSSPPEAGAATVDPSALEGLRAPPGNVLELGTEVIGFLPRGGDVVVEGAPAQVWSFLGQEGETLVFEALSDDFDSILYLFGPGLQRPVVDDDSAGALDSRIEVTLNATGTYTLVVGALSQGAGSYRLRALLRVGGEG